MDLGFVSDVDPDTSLDGHDASLWQRIHACVWDHKAVDIYRYMYSEDHHDIPERCLLWEVVVLVPTFQ